MKNNLFIISPVFFRLETHSDEAQSSSSVLAVTNQQPKEEQEEEPPRYNKVGF